MAVRYQLGEIYDALLKLSEILDDNTAKFEACNLANQLKSYPLIVSIVVWYELLFKFNLVSKQLQDITCDLEFATKELKKVLEFCKKFRQTGFVDVLITSREIAESVDVLPVFPNVNTLRPRRIKRNFDYEAIDEPILDPMKKFEIEYFNVVVDKAIASIQEKFDLFLEHSNDFGFLYDINGLNNKSKDELLNSCKQLEIKLTYGNSKDICGIGLYEELTQLRTMIESPLPPIKILEYIYQKSYQEYFINTTIALRILLTMPVTVASGERSFSCLKLIKTYLRNSIGEERLSDLAQMSIENEVASKIDYQEIIKQFSEEKSRKVSFFLNKSFLCTN